MRTLALVLCWTFGIGSVAHAQALPAWLLVPRSAVASSAPAVPLGAPTQPMAKQARRSKFMIAAGAGLIAAGVVHAAFFSGPVCYERDARLGVPIIAGSAAIAGGLGLTVAGAIRLGRVPREQRSGPTIDRAYLPWTAFGAALLASGLLFAVSAPYIAGCVSS
jgi:hypothetical protein